MSAGLHPFVQHTDDFDQTGFDGAIKDHMNRIADRRLAALIAAMPNVKAANTGSQVTAV